MAIELLAFVWIAAIQAGVAYLVLARAREVADRHQTATESVSRQRFDDLLRTRDALIFGLAALAESRDPDTGNHLERIAVYSTRLASALRRNPSYRNQITPQFLQLIGISSSLHDIGKVGITDSLLLKPLQFDKLEHLVMQDHVTIGGRCIKDIESRLGRSNFLQMARQIALSHHERWDGTGYPEGIAGEEIPLAARIVALADVYDALSAKRVYKDAFAHAQCVEMIRSEAGKHFDPAIVAAFLEIEADFQAIAARWADAAEGETPPTGLQAAAAAASAIDDISAVLQMLDQETAEPPLLDRRSPRGETCPESTSPGRPEQRPVKAALEIHATDCPQELADAS